MKNHPTPSTQCGWKTCLATSTVLSICMVFAGCGSSTTPSIGSSTPPPTGSFKITVGVTDSMLAGVPITASPLDANSTGGGNAGGVLPPAPAPTPTAPSVPSTQTCQSSAATCAVFTLTYPAGSSVTLTAPATTPTPAASAATEYFSKWVGCQSASGSTCTVDVSADTYVEAIYLSRVTVSMQGSVGQLQAIGTNQKITSTVSGEVPDTSVSYTLLGPAGYSGDLGTLASASSSESYQTPYPAPAYVNVLATSNYDPVAFAYLTIQLAQPAQTAGPALTVDTSAVTHPISPLIYGINQFDSGPALQSVLPVPLDRWGGDASTRYNYLLDLTNSASDYYFETNPNNNTAYPDTSQVNTQIEQDAKYGATSMITVPLIGSTSQSPDSTKRGFACGYSVAKYGAQTSVDPYHNDCGTGTLSSTGKSINSNSSGQAQVTNINDTSVAIDQTFVANWVSYLTKKFGTAANGGVKIYELDNEPEYWSGVHSDVHPAYMTYDELVNKGVAYSTAIKTADPTAQVSGPVISGFINYFYSTLDQFSGYGGGNSGNNYCYCYNDNPVDFNAHGKIPLLAYYLQQMQAASTAAGTRLLDYLDLHGYYAANGADFAPAGDTALQTAREDSVRAFWDPTYLGAGETDPYTLQNQNPAPLAVQLIPFMKGLVAANYPGTKTAIGEYNFGGLESMSGAIAQAETLAVFGWQGLDMGALWAPPVPATQMPGVMAFNFFLNYDGAGSKFGDGSLSTGSVINGVDANGNPTSIFGGSQIAIYAAKRSSDGAITVLMFNKTYGPQTTTLALADTSTSVKEFQLSAANLTAIVPVASVPVTAGSGTSPATVSLTLPAQSITLLVFPQ